MKKSETLPVISKAANSFSNKGRRTPAFFRPVIQAKLSINQPNDIYEQEADAMADKVMKTPEGGSAKIFSRVVTEPVQRKCEHCEEEEKLQRKEMDEEKDMVQMKPIADLPVRRKCAACESLDQQIHRKNATINPTSAVSPVVHQTLQSQGQPLDRNTRAFMESRFGYDFGNVQIHNDRLAHQSSKEINALAYTHRNHIAFGAGKYQPNTVSGKKLLAHELTHVVQQNSMSPIRDHNLIQRAVDFSSLACAVLLMAPETGRVNGTKAHNEIGRDFQSQVESPVRIRIQSASFDHFRTEGNGDAAPSSIDPVKFNDLTKSRSGDGIPDLVNLVTSQSDFNQVFEIAEIKIATFGGLYDAETQVQNYIDKAKRGEVVEGYNPKKRKYSQVRGKAEYIKMPTNRFTPKPFILNNKLVAVTWCEPGVILYKVIAQNEDEDKKKKAVKEKEIPKPVVVPEKKRPVKVISAHPDFYQYAQQAIKTQAVPGKDFIVAIDGKIYKQVLDESMKRRLRPMQIDPRGIPFIQVEAPLIPLAIIAAVVDVAALAILLAPAIALLFPEAAAASTAVVADTAVVGTTVAEASVATGTYVTSTGVTLTVIEGGAQVATTANTAAVIANMGKAAAVVAFLVASGSSEADAKTQAKAVENRNILTILDVTNLSGANVQLGSTIQSGGSTFNVIAFLTTR